DISVQLQGGTNALVVLGQQGSQIASAFGPGGALVGALIAVGAGIAGVAMNSRDASKAVEQLEKNLNSLTKSQAQQGLIELAKADADLNKKLAEMEGRRKALSVAEQVGGQTKDQLRDITLKLNAEEE
ncbi:MAG: phage tail tape-measure protein, partial [Hafnia sp.]